MIQTKKVSCEEALKRIFDYLDNALEEAEYCDIEDHLSVCRTCYSRVEFERRLKQHLSHIGEEKAPPELEDKIHAIVQQYSRKLRA